MPGGASGAARTGSPGWRPSSIPIRREIDPLCATTVLASNRQRRSEASTVRALRETIIGLLREADVTLCAECVARALDQRVGVVMMSILGLDRRAASFQGVCSSCHRRARVIGRATLGRD